MSAFEALVLGIVEGITEFLPISSTAHLMFISEALGLVQNDFVKTFEIAIQSGAILAVLALYWRMFLDIEVLKRVGVAFLPTALAGLLLYPFIKESLVGNIPLALATLFLGGIALIVFERWHLKRPSSEPRHLTYVEAMLVGVAQSVAVIPGVSRSAATIVGGLALGINRHTIVEFSFLLAVPTMLAATGLDLLQTATVLSAEEFMALGIGFVSSFVVAVISIRWLLSFVQRHDFTPFGIYRILAAGLFALLIL